MSTDRDPGLFGGQGCDNTRLFGDLANSGLIKCSELGARGKDKSMLSNRGVAPKFLDGALDAVERDGNVGIGARVVIGKLDGGCGFPCSRGSGRGKSGGGEESTGECGDVDQLHFGWMVEKVFGMDLG